MMWPLALAAMISVSGPVAQAPQADDPPPTWHLSTQVVSPATTTDPQHIGFAMGVSRTGTYRAALRYQPTDEGRFGMMHAALGLRVVRRPGWDLALDMEHTQTRARRRLFRGSGWELEGHDRHQLSLVTASVRWHEKRFLGLVGGVEAGGGRLHIWRLVSARAGGGALNDVPDPILESLAPVGMIGAYVTRPLFWGFTGEAHVRLIGAGHSRGGEVPFAHATAEWDLTRQVFRSPRFGRGVFGLTGNHATSSRAASYYQNGLGLTFRIDF